MQRLSQWTAVLVCVLYYFDVVLQFYNKFGIKHLKFTKTSIYKYLL